MDTQVNGTANKVPDVYQIVTDQIIAYLEEGVIPWQKPWGDAGPPMNLISRRLYRGVNLWLLNSLEYGTNLFLTWDQLKDIGGSVKQGEHGQVVVFWKSVKKTPEELDEKGEPKMIGMLRYYKVFNIDQCRDIPRHYLPDSGINPVFDPISDCEQLIAVMNDIPVIEHKKSKAYYDPVGDLINLPKRERFKPQEGYYNTLFHELIHSTGHEKRLNRKTLVDMVPFGSESYSMEELVAEMGSAMLCHMSGILPVTVGNTTSYIKSWLSVFKGDKRFLISASSQAQKAVDYLLNKQEETKAETSTLPEEESVLD